MARRETKRSWRNFWRVINRPRPFDGHPIRIGCTMLLVAYGAIAVLRHDPAHPEFLCIRGAVCAYAVLGAGLASRFTWPALRAFTVGLALLLPLGAAYIDGTLGNDLTQLPLTALATFVPLVFLQVGLDFVVVSVALLAGHGLLLLVVLPPPRVSLTTVLIVLDGSVAAGTAAGLTLQIYRARLQQSLTWWQEACARERTLREFAEVTSGHLGGEDLLDELAERFRLAFGEGGRCAIVLRDGDAFRVAAAAGFDALTAAALKTLAVPPNSAAVLSGLIADRRPIVRGQLTDAERQVIAEHWPDPFTVGRLAALPLVIEDVVAGAVVLVAPGRSAIGNEEPLLWQAMASQMGVAVANARLLARLRQALHAKSEFLNTMSHELRSPIHVIVGYTDIAREEAAASEVALHALDRVRASALELLQLVENTMNAARLDAGKVSLRVEEFAPEELARELADSVRALPEATNGVAVRWEIAPDLPRVRLDRLKVKEIVQNLVSNALKFTPQGEVRVILGRDGDRLRIAVRDTGVGIPPEAQARIFGMFERVEHGDGRGPAGIGLGLYIVTRLVELMHGRAGLESAPGAGSCFTVQLPLRLDQAADPGPA